MLRATSCSLTTGLTDTYAAVQMLSASSRAHSGSLSSQVQSCCGCLLNGEKGRLWLVMTHADLLLTCGLAEFCPIKHPLPVQKLTCRLVVGEDV